MNTERIQNDPKSLTMSSREIVQIDNEKVPFCSKLSDNLTCQKLLCKFWTARF